MNIDIREYNIDWKNLVSEARSSLSAEEKLALGSFPLVFLGGIKTKYLNDKIGFADSSLYSVGVPIVTHTTLGKYFDTALNVALLFSDHDSMETKFSVDEDKRFTWLDRAVSLSAQEQTISRVRVLTRAIDDSFAYLQTMSNIYSVISQNPAHKEEAGKMFDSIIAMNSVLTKIRTGLVEKIEAQFAAQNTTPQNYQDPIYASDGAYNMQTQKALGEAEALFKALCQFQQKQTYRGK